MGQISVSWQGSCRRPKWRVEWLTRPGDQPLIQVTLHSLSHPCPWATANFGSVFLYLRFEFLYFRFFVSTTESVQNFHQFSFSYYYKFLTSCKSTSVLWFIPHNILLSLLALIIFISTQICPLLVPHDSPRLQVVLHWNSFMSCIFLNLSNQTIKYCTGTKIPATNIRFIHILDQRLISCWWKRWYFSQGEEKGRTADAYCNRRSLPCLWGQTAGKAMIYSALDSSGLECQHCLPVKNLPWALLIVCCVVVSC